MSEVSDSVIPLFGTLSAVFENWQTHVRVSRNRMGIHVRGLACGFETSKIYSKQIFAEAECFAKKGRQS